MGPNRAVVSTLVKSVQAANTTSCQIKLLKSVLDSDSLLQSKIISSVRPKIGKRFIFTDIQNEADNILRKCRENLLKLSVKEYLQRNTKKKKFYQVQNKELKLLWIWLNQLI